jgi:hypothetical protein
VVKRRTRIALFALVPLLLVIGGFIAAPSWIEDAVEARVETALKSRGIESNWRSFSAGLGRSFEIEGLVLHIPRLGISIRSERVRVGIHIEDLTEQDVTLTEVLLDHVDLDWDIESTPSLGTDDPPASSLSDGSEKMGRLMRSVMENPPKIIAKALRLNIKRDGLLVAAISSEHLKATPTDSTYELSGKGLARLVSATAFAPQLLKDIPWTAEGSLRLDDRRIEMSLTSWDEEPLIDLGDSETFRFRLESLGATLHASPAEIELRGSGLMARFGDHRKPAMHVIVPTWAITKRADHGLFLTADHPLIHVAPQVDGNWNDLKALARDLFRSPPDAHHSQKKLAVKRQPEIWSSLLRGAARIGADIRNLKLEVDVVDETGDSDTLTLIHDAFVHLDQGRLMGRGSVADGEVSIQAEILPGIARPSFITTELRGVVLEEIPGMPKSRSQLPSRGTSGRIGGKVDGHITMIFPTLLYETTPNIEANGLIDLNWHDGLIDLAGVSDEPLTSINATATGAWAWKPAVDELRFERMSFSWGPVQVSARASIQSVSFDPELTLRARMKEIECEDLFRAIPNGLLGPMRHLTMDGDVAPKLYFRLPVHRPRKLRLYLSQYEDSCTLLSLSRKPIAPGGLRFTRSSPDAQNNGGERDLSDVGWLADPFVKTLTKYVPEDADVRVGPGLDSYVPLDELPPYVGGIAYLSEQILFYEDPAVSLALMTKALGLNLERRRFVYGGSTVTQQLIKNLFLSRDKTLARKVREALISWRVLDIIPRKRILELYLNCIEYAPGVYGIGPAAQFYFQKDARNLTPNEAVFLAMLKPAPHRGIQYVDRGKTPVRQTWWKKRVDQLFDRLVGKGYLTKASAEAERPYILRWDKEGKYIPTKHKRPFQIPLLE